MGVLLHGGHQQSGPTVSVAGPEALLVVALGVLLVVLLARFAVDRYLRA